MRTGQPTSPPNSRWVIHLPITVPDLVRARIFARTAARVLAHLTVCVDAGEVTVSAEDEQGVRHRVFCDRLLTGGARCALPVDHLSACTTRADRPNPTAPGQRNSRPGRFRPW